MHAYYIMMSINNYIYIYIHSILIILNNIMQNYKCMIDRN